MLFKCPLCGDRHWTKARRDQCARSHQPLEKLRFEHGEYASYINCRCQVIPIVQPAKRDDYLSDPLHPLHPLNPMNPASPVSPLWNDNTAAGTHTRDHCYDSTPSTYSYDSGSSSDSGCSSSSD